MARIRTIKPELWTSEQIIGCSLQARLLFIGLWNFCGDNGVHPASYIRLKAEVFPIDAISVDDIRKYISELISNNLIREYVFEDTSYWIVTGWKKHQKIDKPTYRYPLPQSSFKEIPNSMSIIRKLDEKLPDTSRIIGEHSTTTRQGFDEPSGTEWSLMERNRKDISEAEASPSSKNKIIRNDHINEIFTYWQKIMGHPKAVLDAKRKRIIEKALKSYELTQIKSAIDGCAKTPFNMGQNDRSQIYDSLNLILRDADHIGKFIAASGQEANNDILEGAL